MSELVGRDREIDALASYRREAADGRGRIVLVAGDAGVGKSRLLQAFEENVTSGRAIAASARCVEFVQTPLGPLRELLLHLGKRGTASLDAKAQALVERLTFERDADPNAGGHPSGALFDAIDDAFARYALRGTVVLLVEDVHWADRSTLGFLTYLADRIGKRRTLVVATYRSDEVGAGHPSLREFSVLLTKPSVARIALAPLDERSSNTLVLRALPRPGALDPATISHVVRRSQGNPFFAEELLKDALERGAGSSATELPLSIRGAVLARAALLAAPEREILSRAAVLGERFSVDRLIALSDGRRDAVLSALERARSLNLIDDRRTAPGELTFRHALTQEVLYDELLAEGLRPLHEAIAQELQRLPDHRTRSVELAHHWRRAGNLERAASYAETAGDRSFAIGAIADAIAYYERALADRKADTAEYATLIHKIGVALGALNDFASGVVRLRRAAELFWTAGDYEGFATNASALGAQLYNAGDTAGAIEFYRQTIAALAPKVPSAALDLLRSRIAYNCIAALDFETALAFVSEVQEPIADALAADHVYQARFKVEAMRGDVNAWRADVERALAAARQIGNRASLRHTHSQIALDALGLGEIDLAREHFHAAMPEEPDANSWTLTTLNSAASAFEHVLRGDFKGARALLGDIRDTPGQSYAILVHVKIASFALGICAGDDARLRRDDSESFLRYGTERGMKLAIGLVGGPYAWTLGLRGELEDAAAWIHRIAEIIPGPHRFLFAYLAAAQFGASDDVARMHEQLAQAATRPQDRVNKAALALFEAFASQRGLMATPIQERALEAAARFDAIGWPWLAARGYELGGERKRALETYRALGALRDVRRLETVRDDATVALLSAREREVAELVAAGHSNDEIAQVLHISLRTVEKHVSSSLHKLNVRSRLQLGRLLGSPGPAR
ncbi:MAG TPA: AAA family ATPase [Candidatus Cybelea sp.]|nr:AAA family ATPase [Candidatus Cybelea sp.]